MKFLSYNNKSIILTIILLLFCNLQYYYYLILKFILNFAATIITDRENGKSKGFGFVTFYDGRHVQDVIDQLHQKVNTVDIRPSYKN